MTNDVMCLLFKYFCCVFISIIIGGIVDVSMFWTCFLRSPDDESVLIVSTYSKAFSQSFENLLDDVNYGFVQVCDLYQEYYKSFVVYMSLLKCFIV